MDRKEEIVSAIYQYLREKAKEQSSLTNIDYGAFVKGKSLEQALMHSVSNYSRINEDEKMVSFYKVIYSERATSVGLVANTEEQVMNRTIINWLGLLGVISLLPYTAAVLFFLLAWIRKIQSEIYEKGDGIEPLFAKLPSVQETRTAENMGNTTVYRACGCTDFRKRYTGLAAIIKLKFHLDTYSRCMFAFCNRRRILIKILQWDG